MGKENLQRLMEEATRGQPLDPEMLRDMRVRRFGSVDKLSADGGLVAAPLKGRLPASRG